MAKNQNSVVVFWIWLKFWCIPMGVKYKKWGVAGGVGALGIAF